MTVWTGTNWQLIDADDAQAVVGVTFGTGLLDEEIVSTGTLSLALSALRAELARPVDLGGGNTFVPEVAVELGTDTSSVALRGSMEGISAAWRRLPGLFTPATVTDGTVPLRPEASAWPADLVRRTGHNAAALAWLQTTAPDARQRAAGLMPRLNPSQGAVPAVFFTTAEALVGLAFPVRHDGGPAHRTLWADGTPACTVPEHAADPAVGRGRPGSPRCDDSLGLSPTSSGRVLLSAMVPRSAAGQVAAELICRQLSAIAANTIGFKGAMGAEYSGAGAASHVVVLTETAITGPARHELLRVAGRSLTLLPDSWIEDAVAASSAGVSPGLERERRLMGLPAESPVTASQVRRAVYDAAAHALALNFLPASAGLGSTKQLDDESTGHGRQHIFKSRVGRITPDARPQPWGPVPPQTAIDSIIMDQRSIRLGGFRPGHGRRARIAEGVATEAAVAVLQDNAGTLVIVDDRLRSLTLQPELFHHPKKLRRVLEERLAGVPRLSFTSGVDQEKLRRHIRSRQRAKWWPVSGVVLLVGGIVVFNVATAPADTSVTARITVGDTVQLHNGTRIMVSDLVLVPGTPGATSDRATVQVEFCAGGDTKAKGLETDAQREISAGDFVGFNYNAGSIQPLEGPGRLRPATLEEGQCVGGSLEFAAPQLENPRVAYKNKAGDDVVWYPAGQVPNRQ